MWTTTVESHRDAVRDAVVEAAATLVDRDGLASLTMSAVAQQAGIGRATLYKYFDSLETVLQAWHGRQVHEHLRLVTDAAAGSGTPIERLEAVLIASGAAASHAHPGDVAAVLHGSEHVRAAGRHLSDLLARLIQDAADAGEVREDVPPAELAQFCLHAMTAAGSATVAARRRLVDVVLGGLRS